MIPSSSIARTRWALTAITCACIEIPGFRSDAAPGNLLPWACQAGVYVVSKKFTMWRYLTYILLACIWHTFPFAQGVQIQAYRCVYHEIFQWCYLRIDCLAPHRLNGLLQYLDSLFSTRGHSCKNIRAVQWPFLAFERGIISQQWGQRISSE